MSTPVRSVPAAATGATFAVVLTLANGQGGHLSDTRDVLASAALALLIPFVAYLGVVLRSGTAEDVDHWLVSTAVTAGTAGAAMKLASGAPEIARSHSGLSPTSDAAAALVGVADAMTVLALFPLALCCLAIGAVALRTRALPAWVGIGALVTGMALAVNGCFRGIEVMPALLLFTLWCLVTSIQQVIRALREREPTATAPQIADR